MPVDASRIVEIVFQGSDQTGPATQSAIANTNDFARNLETATQPIANFTLGALQMEAAVAAAGIALVGFGVSAAGEFDAGFREITTLIQQPVEELGEFRQAILDYAATSTQPLDQVTRAIYSAISAGVPLADAIDAVSQAERLSVAGRADLNDSLLALVSTLNAYGLGVDGAQRVSDALFTTVRLGQTTLPELNANLANVTGTAAALNVPIETVLAALAALTSSGTPTAQAVTQINAVLTALIRPSNEAAELAQSLGIQFGAQAVQAIGLEGVLRQVAQATGGNQEQMARLFGSVEAVRAVFPLTGIAAERFGINLRELSSSTGAVEEAFRRMGSSVEQSNARLANSVTSLLISIGDPLLDEYRSVTDSIAAVFNALGVSIRSGELGSLVDYIEAVFGDVAATLRRVAANLPAALEGADLSGFQRGIEVVIEAVQQLFRNLDLTSPEGLRNAIETLGTAFLNFQSFVAGVIRSLEPLVQALFTAGDGANRLGNDFFSALGNISGILTQVNALAGAMQGLSGVITAVVAVMGANSAVSLIGTLGRLAPALAGISVAPILAIGAGAAAIYTTAVAVDGLVEANRHLSESQETSEQLTGRMAERLAELSRELGISITSYEQFDELVRNGTIVADEQAGTWRLATQAAGGLAEATAAMRLPFADSTVALQFQAAITALATRETNPFIDAVRQATGAIESQAGASLTLGEATANLTTETQRAEEALLNYNLELARIRSAEAIESIRSGTAIATAQIEADTQRMEAAFSSLDATIASTGETLLGLTGIYAENANSLSFSSLRTIEDQITAESERRDEALRLQRELTEAQISELRARTESLANGDALITVDGAGLQPQLEAFMFEILRAIQVRVNRDGLEFLVGA